MRRYVNRFSVIFSGYCIADRATVHLKDIFNIFQYHRLHILVDFSQTLLFGGLLCHINGLIKSDSCRHVLFGCCFGSVCCVGLGVFNIIFCTEIPETSWIYPHVSIIFFGASLWGPSWEHSPASKPRSEGGENPLSHVERDWGWPVAGGSRLSPKFAIPYDESRI